MAGSSPPDCSAILDELKLEASQVQELSGRNHAAVIHGDWLSYLTKNGSVPSARELSVPQTHWDRLPPRPAHGRVDSPWRRVDIEVIPKPEVGKILVPRIHPKWLMKGELGFVDFMQCLSKQNYLSQWEQTYQTYAMLMSTRDSGESSTSTTSCELSESLKTLFNCPVYKIGQSGTPEPEKSASGGNTAMPFLQKQQQQQQQQQHPNMMSVLCVLDCPVNFYVVRPHVEHTLHDCITFSPAMLGGSHARPLFVIYQMVRAFDHCHRLGLPCGNVSLRDFSLDEDLWLQFRGPRWTDVVQEVRGEPQSPCEPISRGSQKDPEPERGTPRGAEKSPGDSLPELVLRWVKGELSNFDYLMRLNSLAGRQPRNPNHHPVLPWVMDFTRPDGGYRDLSRSKYRLTKGDHQLDFMYESSPGPGPAATSSSPPSEAAGHVPHHISDVLSEITYYVYTARRTPRPVLCAHVRSTWVPNEYPSSLQRLQEWSPDECIPEFFSDPDIFTSIHEDLSDLELPSWCSGPEDFISKHRAVLESDHVSEKLHRWIDLTFGYKLSGSAAVRAKNVCLHLVDQHTQPANHGAVQLFNFPHPRRLVPSPYLSPTPPAVVRREPRVEGSSGGSGAPTGRAFDLDKTELVAQADSAVMAGGQPRRMSDFGPRISATEVAPEASMTSSQTDSAGQGSGPDSSTASAVSETASDVNLEVSLSTMETINLISGIGGGVSKAPPPDAALQLPSGQAVAMPTADDTSLLKNPIKKLPFFRSKADAPMDAKPSAQRPEQMAISLPEDYDPLAALNQLESLYSFSSKVLQGLPSDRSEHFPADRSVGLLGHDMHVLGCLIVELFLAPKLRMQHQHSSLLERCRVLRRLLETEWSDLPRAVRQVTRLLLEMDTKPNRSDLTDCLYSQPDSGLHLPTASMLLQPCADLIPFPSYMANLYKMLVALPAQAGGAASKTDAQKQSLSQIHQVAGRLPQITRRLTAEGRDLLLPHLLRLFAGPETSLYACLLLLAKVAQCLGRRRAASRLLPSLTRVYDAEFASPNCMLLFHRAYLAQLMTWLGLGPFLDHIVGFVVDAVTGLKDCPEFGTAVDDPMTIIGQDKKPGPDRPTDDDDEDDALDLIRLEEVDDLPGVDRVGIPLVRPDEEVSENSSSEEEDAPDAYESSRKNSASTDTSSLEQAAPMEDIQEDVAEARDEGLPPEGARPDAAGAGQAPREASEGPEPTGNDLPESCAPREPTEASAVRAAPGETEPCRESGTQSEMDGVARRSRESRPEPDAERPAEPDEDPMHEYLMSSLAKGRMTAPARLAPGARLVEVAAGSVTWLARRLGPALTATYLTGRLLRALKDCYTGAHLLSYCELDSDSDSSDDEYGVYIEQRTVLGDSNAKTVLGCLTDVALLYGDQFIFKQYLTHIQETVCSVRHKVNLKAEAGLVACLALLRHLLPFLTDTQLMDHLIIIFRKVLQPLVNVVQSCQLSFPSGGQARAVLCYKLVDVMTTVGLRIGREMAREHMTATLQHFFVCFELVHGDGRPSARLPSDMEHRLSQQFSHSTDSEDMYCEIKVDSQTNQYMIGTPTKLENLHGEMTRSPPTVGFQMSENLDSLDDGHCVDPDIMKELREAFSAEMANTAYVPLCRLIGSIHMERILYNHDLIWKLSNQHERTLANQRAAYCASVKGSETGEAEKRQTSWFVDIGALDGNDDALFASSTANAHIVGNRIDIAQYGSDSDSGQEEAASSKPVRLSSYRPQTKRQNPSLKMGKSKRQLKDGWLSYWHNYCENAPSSLLTFNHIKLQTFSGHSGGIKALYTMDNENLFLSASKDKTVKLWSLRNQGSGSGGSGSSGKSGCRYTYRHHRKGVFAVTFLESQRLVASCDGSIHLWDPFSGALVHRYDLSKFVPSILVRMPAPSPVLVVGTTESSVRLIDTRSSVVQHELKVASGALGLIRCLAVSPGSTTLGVGLSSGVLSMVDLSCGLLLGGWRAHDGEVMQIKACHGKQFLTSSVDHTMAMWREDGTRVCTLRGSTEPVHCMCISKGQVVSATTSNRIGLHTSLDQQASYSSYRIRPDLARGMTTALDVLPLKRLFLLGSDNGSVSLLA